jgi:hypothetical protein
MTIEVQVDVAKLFDEMDGKGSRRELPAPSFVGLISLSVEPVEYCDTQKVEERAGAVDQEYI